MAQLSEWLELMLAEIARRQEEAQLDAEEEARRRRELSAAADANAPLPEAPGITTAGAIAPADATGAIAARAPRRRLRG
jgi:hypothetical protein